MRVPVRPHANVTLLPIDGVVSSGKRCAYASGVSATGPGRKKSIGPGADDGNTVVAGLLALGAIAARVLSGTLAVDAGVPALTPHDAARHTWATLALASGVHPKVVQERLGHSSIAITLDRYSHVIEGYGPGRRGSGCCNDWQAVRLLAVILLGALFIGGCGPQPPEGDVEGLRELRHLIEDACGSYVRGMSNLLEFDSAQLAAAEFGLAAQLGDAASDLMFENRSTRVEAGYTESEALLHGFPAFGGFSRLYDLLSAGPTEFVGYEALVGQAVSDAEDDCGGALDLVDRAEDAR